MAVHRVLSVGVAVWPVTRPMKSQKKVEGQEKLPAKATLATLPPCESFRCKVRRRGRLGRLGRLQGALGPCGRGRRASACQLRGNDTAATREIQLKRLT